jgi:hypothetical protein
MFSIQGLYKSSNAAEEGGGQMKVNIRKSVTEVFKKCLKLGNQENWRINGRKVEWVNEFNYLTITLDSKEE